MLVSLWNAFFFQSLAPVSKSDVCVCVCRGFHEMFDFVF